MTKRDITLSTMQKLITEKNRLFCLGVKDAGFYPFHSITDYQEGLLGRLFPDGTSVRTTPEAARKLTEDAISYARAFGSSPAADFKKASRVFGGITTVDCTEQFVFGKDGKPFYIQGPSESPGQVERILRALEAKCGEGGYNYTIAGYNFEPFEEQAGTAGLQLVRRLALLLFSATHHLGHFVAQPRRCYFLSVRSGSRL